MNAAFLTKVEIDHETAYEAGLRDSYAWHKKVWEMFPGRGDQTRDFLTRLDGIDGGFRLLVVSATQPAKPNWCPEPAWHSKPLTESFLEHSRFRFSLIANPTRKLRSESNPKNGRRVPITHREDREVEGKTQPGLLSWLRRKGEQHGFSFEESTMRTIPKPRQWFLKKGAAGVHSATEFVGILSVTDPAQFRAAVAQGVGSAKAFGFGMLCLSPA
jgi:CRISPR system Cascade subunit CasE